MACGSLGVTSVASRARMVGLAAMLASEVAIGSAVALAQGSAGPLALLAAGMPFVVLLTNFSIETAAFIIAAAQGFEGLELSTPVATVSLGKLAIVVFLLARVVSLDEPLDLPGPVVLYAALLTATALPQVLWGDPRAVLPAVMTALAFVTGYVLGKSSGGLSMVARGFSALLIGIGLLYLVGLPFGLISSDTAGRSLFGFATPIPRMRYDLILGGLMGWFAPLCGVMAGAYLRRERGSHIRDLLAWGVLLILGLLVFQTRGFVIGLCASLVFTTVDYSGGVARAGFRVAVTLLPLLALGVIFAQSVDPLSTAIRLQSDQFVIAAIRANPSILALGLPLPSFEHALDAAITVYSQPQGAPLHGGWLRFVLEGGLTRVLVVLSLLLTPVVVARRRVLTQGDASSFALSAALAVAVAVGLQLVTDSPSNNAWALWLTIGCVWGLVLGGGGLQHWRGAGRGEHWPSKPRQVHIRASLDPSVMIPVPNSDPPQSVSAD